MNKPPRNLWPASIAGFFVLAITFLATFVVWAVRQREDLVSADYYEREIRYQQQLDSLKRSQSLVAHAVVTFEPAQQVVVITLPAAKRENATGQVQLYRPSDARMDRELPLALAADGTQKLDARSLADGLWKVRVRWSAGGQEYYLEQPVIVTGAPASDPPRS